MPKWMRGIAIVAWITLFSALTARGQEKCDVFVYGGTSGGVTAAVEAARSGKTVILAEPGSRIGGLSSGGLGWTDPRDEFTDTGNWTPQLYVRESRRMLGETVATERTLRDDTSVKRSIGMGAYNMDSHNAQRYVNAAGHVRNEGDVQIGVPHPYRIDYGVITPKAEQCENLLVPVCLSASHIAYGSIRMEPVFMVLGQSAGAAAALAIDEQAPVQKVSYEKLEQRLTAEHQVLAWMANKAARKEAYHTVRAVRPRKSL